MKSSQWYSESVNLLPRGSFLLFFALFFAVFLTLAPAADASVATPPDSKPTFTFTQFAAGKPLHMVAYGDMRFTNPAITSKTNPKVRKWLVDRIAEEHPQVLLLTGDMPMTGANPADWQEFAQETAPWRAENILQLPTTGNHEAYGGLAQGIANYLQSFPELAGHRYYSVLLGNVEVIALDCTSANNAAAPQARWFAAQLDHLPAQADFLLILYHIPWMADRQSQYVVGLPSKDALLYRGILETRLGRIRAKVIVFNGHIHNYERFEREGVEYVVTGGGGAEPYPILIRGRADLYRDTGFPVYHYLTLDVTGRTLHAVMWKIKNPDAATLEVEAKDEFTVNAPEPKRSPKPARRSAKVR